MESTNNLQLLRNNIEKLDKVHHVNIFKILKKNNVKFTENTNGIFINLITINAIVINEIKNYVKYVKLQELELGDVENKKKEYLKEFYNDNKELATY